MKQSKFTIRRTIWTQYLLIFFGSFLYAAATNLFVVPMQLYNSGFVGLSQIIRTILVQYAHLSLPQGFDIAGIINFMFNIPLFYLAYHSISKGFLLRTVFSVVTQTICFSLIKIPTTPIIDDLLSACLIGGIATGVGIGIIFYASGSGGGVDIIGFWATKKYPGITVGQLSIYFNAVVYAVCAILFDVRIAIYSIIYIAIYSFVIDRIHLQNINTMALIISKKKDIADDIMYSLHRGVTRWDATGQFTNSDTNVYMTMVSKYEINQLRHFVHEKDPHAFIVLNEGARILGNFKKHL